ncbi:Cytochrome c [Burkholderia sp. OK233]|nr:Cytochrome c [Burkholderia sp. OK233]
MYAIERFELEDPSFHPYTSKFDYYLDGKLQLTALELRGKKLFDNPTGGNCASCHIDQSGVDGSHPLFTDFNFPALGVPRNPELRANANTTDESLTRKAGERPVWSDRDIDDVAAFLATLNDNYALKPKQPK